MRSKFLRNGLLVSLVAVVALGSVIALNRHASGELSFKQLKGVLYEVPAQPGQTANFSIAILADTDRRIVLDELSLIPVNGFMTPQLTHVAHFARGSGYIPSATNWPPVAVNGESAVKILKFTGAIINPNVHKGNASQIIVFGVSGSITKSAYAFAGIKLTYSANGVRYSSSIFKGGLLCVFRFNRVLSTDQENLCQALRQSVASSLAK